MKKTFVLTILTQILFSLNLIATEKKNILSVDKIIESVENAYNKYPTFKAKFNQIYYDSNFGEIKSSGSVWFKRPGMMKWEYKKPSKKLIVSNGSSMWVFDPRDSQVILDKNFNQEALPSALSFLWGSKKIKDVFTYKLYSFEQSNNSKTYTVELLPKEEMHNVKRILFVIKADSFNIKETSIFDSFGNENRLIFEKQSMNENIKNSFFVFNPPKNVVVVESPKLKK